jgi:Complex I intermediate-associated protein 30 (CIA30)
MSHALFHADEGHVYAARFPTRPGRYSTVRLPWALFRPEREGQPPLEPAAIRRMGLRYELRRAAPQQQQQPGSAAPPPPSAALPAAEEPAPAPAGAALPPGARLRPGVASPGTALARERAEAAAANARFERFKLEVDWIKAMRSGVEPDFVLVSCSGAGRQGVEPADLARIVAAKRRGEEALRTTGLGYTIIRPGPLVVRYPAFHPPPPQRLL